MSKHLLVVNLPYKEKCTGCKFYHYRTQGGIGVLFHDIGTCGDSLFPEIVNENRPDDCPLIPVNGLIERIGALCNAQGDVAYRAIGIIEDELGLEEDG